MLNFDADNDNSSLRSITLPCFICAIQNNASSSVVSNQQPRPKGLNLTHKNLIPPGTGKIPGKTLVESVFAIFDTLRRGIPNVFPGLSPVPGVEKKIVGQV
jgi:hypothetical protein